MWSDRALASLGLAGLLTILIANNSAAAPQAKWCSDFATVNGTAVTHGQNADPDTDTPDPARIHTDYRRRTALRLAVRLAPFTPPATSSGLYDAEPFDYTAAGPLHNQAGGVGFSGGWVQTAPTPITPPKNVISSDGSL